MSAAQAAPGLRVAVGTRVFDAADTQAVAKAIAAQNARRRIPGLADEFNPSVIDPDKLLALLRAVSPDSVRALAGRPLFLDSIGLGIAASSPTGIAGFAGPVALALGEDDGTVAAKAAIPVDCEAARRRAAAARTLAQAADDEVRATEARHGDSGPVRTRRFAVARAWAVNAGAAASCAPGDPAAAADRDAAAKLAAASVVLGGAMD